MSRMKVLSVLFASGLMAASLAGAAPAREMRPPAPSGVGGTVSLVEEPCPFAGCGISATVIARRAGRVVAWTEADARGRYSMDLRPGAYELLAWPHIRGIACAPVDVDVPPGKHVRADIGCRWDARPA